MDNDDFHSIDLDLHHLGGRAVLAALPLVLHQDLELHQAGVLVAQASQEVDASATEVVVQPVEGDVVRLPQGGAGSIAGGVAAPDAVGHSALLTLLALGNLAGDLPAMQVALALLPAYLIPPELLSRGVETSLVDAATAPLWDALTPIQHVAMLALASLYAWQATLVLGCKVIARGRAGGATELVLAVLWARQSCQRERNRRQWFTAP